MERPEYVIETVVSAPFEQNAYIAWRKGRADALVIDPGFDVPALRAVLDRNGLKPTALVLTHGHADHIAGLGPMKQAYPEAEIVIGRNEAGMLTDPEANLSGPFGVPLTCPPADRLVAEGERYEAAGFAFEVREIPGHSPGSVVYVCDQEDPPFVFAGDVLFAGSVGRVDFPGGSGPLLVSGIKAKLFNLPDGALILPGHGPATTVGQERRTNPFVGEGGDPTLLD